MSTVVTAVRSDEIRLKLKRVKSNLIHHNKILAANFAFPESGYRVQERVQYNIGMQCSICCTFYFWSAKLSEHHETNWMFSVARKLSLQYCTVDIRTFQVEAHITQTTKQCRLSLFASTVTCGNLLQCRTV